MYRIMQYYYHAGLVLGILGLGVFAYAFRCWRAIYYKFFAFSQPIIYTYGFRFPFIQL
jgi:hypothetical protein